MANKITHRGVAIVTLEDGEAVLEHCKPNCIAIRHDDAGWWTCFVGPNGEVDDYDQPFPSRDQAVWAAKAAAEYGI
ncbi:hypothetical protein ASC94_05240 [Massilia sp. Root418]|jgi:hypothetical protein|uniref:hypothetical protein n=1 Tax=Massilia sp. Root418 TaxID=1736532 RepID=UPI0006F5FD57|nr:hypothetical protein [Massilia sp. Root418]KQX01978.1 hypothetical protein ASC94_05240 [Massilia sp. Root418]